MGNDWPQFSLVHDVERGRWEWVAYGVGGLDELARGSSRWGLRAAWQMKAFRRRYLNGLKRK